MEEETGLSKQGAFTEGEDVLSGGIETLERLKENLLELEEYRQKCGQLDEEETKIEKQIELKKKAAADEIAAISKQRRLEIEESFNIEMNKARGRMKKLRAKKEKLKNAKVSERIQIETAELKDEKKAEKAEIKAIYRKEQMSRFFNHRLFFALFLPKGLIDFLIAFLSLLILTLLPCGIYFLLIPQRKVWMLILIYVAVIFIFGGLYALITTKVKERHLEALKQVRTIQMNIRRIEKQERRTARAVYKDRDESGYGLEKYDDQLKEFQGRIDELAEQEKQALMEFDSQTQTALAKEVMSRYETDLDELMLSHENIEAEQSAADQKARDFSVEVTRKYEGFLGKDLISLPVVDALIALIQEGRASTTAGAALIYRQELQAKSSSKKGR